MTVVLRLKHVSKHFGATKALDDISCAVKKGEIVGFVGANGAGKTTTISTILGFIDASEGEVEVFGETVRPAMAHRLHGKIGYAAGDMELPPRLTGQQFLSFVLHQSKGDHTTRLAELVRKFKPELDKKIGTLSRGNKQKLALVAAFVTDPELIILDEPTSGLDPVMQEVFLQLVREVQAAGVTVFMSSHYLSEVAEVCSRVILMRDGKIIRDLAAKEMLTKSGKAVRVVSGYKALRPPLGAEEVVLSHDGGKTVLSFVSHLSPAKLQVWVAGVKQLEDIEITEYNLEGVFASLYEGEEKSA